MNRGMAIREFSKKLSSLARICQGLKMFKKFAVCLLLIAANLSCMNHHVYADLYTGRIPGTTDSYQLADGTYYQVDLTAAGIEFFYDEWKKEFGDEDLKVYKAINKIRLVWIDTGTFFHNCSGMELYGVVDDKKNIVEVAVRAEDKSIAATSLAHELVHIANFAVNGKYDYDHSMGTRYSGWTGKHDALIIQVNDRLRTFEQSSLKESP